MTISVTFVFTFFELLIPNLKKMHLLIKVDKNVYPGYKNYKGCCFSCRLHWSVAQSGNSMGGT